MAGVTSDQVLWSVPESERVDRPWMIMLHGHGMNERMGIDLHDQLPHPLVLASIRGPLRVGAGYGWFPLDATLSLDQIDTAAHAVLDWVDTQSGFSQIGILGFSQGSSIALQCMRLRPQLFAFGVVLSGFAVPGRVVGDAELARLRPPVFSGRGDADRLVPQPLVMITDGWLDGHVRLTRRTYRGLGHNVSAEEISDLGAFLEDRLAPLQ